jgi:hypothetical protein
MAALLATFTAPGLGVPPRSFTGAPELSRRAYVTLEMTSPPGNVSASPTVPVSPSGIDVGVELGA